jgi:hypothetical protein
MKNNKIKICTRCGSINIGINGDFPFNFCKDCNLNNLNEPTDKEHLILEINKTKLKEFQKAIKKDKKNK